MTEYAANPKEAKSRGDAYYYTGKPCKHGHDSVRLASTRQCYDCKNEARNKWCKEHPEQNRAAAKRFREANPEKSNLMSRQKYAKNPEKYNGIKRKWKQNNREQDRRISLICRWANIEAYRERARQWHVENRDKSRANVRRRRAMRHLNGSVMTSAEQRKWESAQPKVCCYCGVDCAEKYHIDHVVPIAKGGEHQAHNLAIACPSCNQRKGAKDVSEFLEGRSFLDPVFERV